MQVRKFLKNYKGIDGRIALNNRLIYLLKEDAMMFLDDSDHDKAIREICITKAREIKAESDGLIKDKEKLTNAVQKLPQLQKKIVNLFYVQRLKAPECCEIMGCTKNQFYYMKESAVQELERMLNEDETHSDL